jgi:hypothetical protein
VAVLVLQVAEGRELAHLARERVEQPDAAGDGSVAAAVQEQEALGGSGSENAVVDKLRDVHLDALAGGDVQEAATAAVQGVVVEHDPPAGAEAGVVQDAALAGVVAATPPRPAHGPEAYVAGHVVGEDALGDQARRPVPEIRPAPAPAAAVSGGARALGDARRARDCRR